MTLMKLPRLSIALVSAVTLAVVSFTSYLSPVEAQSATPSNKTPSGGRVRSQRSPSNQKSPDFSGYGRPGRRAGGGSRNPCPVVASVLTALMPETNWGKTVAQHPTLWFDVPYSPQQASAGEFVLQEEQGGDVYRTAFTLPKTPGLVSFTIPPTVAPLEINKWYRWYVKLYCGPQKSSTPVFVQGWVQRVALTPELTRQLQATTSKAYLVYANYGIWYDALARLAKLRLANPANPVLEQDWANLLSLPGIGLEQLKQEPIVGSAILDQRLVSD